jgi:L-ascorbate metabolism protein UlaG (beta-lactamase superfamily)
MADLSDHFDGQRFFNPWGPSAKGLLDVLRWKLAGGAEPWPARVVDAPAPPLPEMERDRLSATFLGHASLLWRLPGLAVLTDPIFSRRASPFSWIGPARVRPAAFGAAGLPPVDAVLVSHNHYDHLDLPTLRSLAARGVSMAIAPLGNGRVLRAAGFERVIELDWWESVDLAGGRVTLTPAQHWSSRSPFDRNRALWGGFRMEAGGRSAFFPGDTGYGPHFKAIRERLGPVDLAALPIGAYEPRWFMASMHMDPHDAVQAHLDLGARASAAMHWGTFRLTDESIEAPLRGLEAARAEAGLAPETFRILAHGETWIP